MTSVFVTTRVRNPRETARFWEGPLLVDTGATHRQLPKQHLESIGLVPKRQRMGRVSDGKGLGIPVTTKQVEFVGEVIGTTIEMGDGLRSLVWVRLRRRQRQLRWTRGLRS